MPPNIILITADQMRWDAMGCVGRRPVHSPNLDRMARSGIRFTGATSECPCCVPARRVIHSGAGPWVNHQFNNSPQTAFDVRPWLAECLGGAGYQTWAVGKMHLSPARLRIGFDDVVLCEEGRREDDMRLDDYEMHLQQRGLLEQAWAHGMPANGYDARPHNLPEPDTPDAWTAREACRFISRRDPTRPFFLNVNFRTPHPALVPPQAQWDLYRDVPVPEPHCGSWLGTDREPAYLRRKHVGIADLDQHARKRAVRAYHALVSSIDQQLGMLFAHLKEHWLLGDTVLIFTADHGEMLFDHECFAKGVMYESSCRVPLIIVPPSNDDHGIPRGETRDHCALLQDLMPTILDCCDLAIPEHCEGRSLLPVMRDAAAGLRPYAVSAFYDDTCDFTVGLTDNRWKYIWWQEGGLEQLFDLQADPYECSDLADDPAHADELARWRQRLIDELSRRGDPAVVDGVLQTRPEREPGPRYMLGDGMGIHWPNVPHHDFAPESQVTVLDRRRQRGAQYRGQPVPDLTH